MLAAQIINEDTNCANDQAEFLKIKSLGVNRKYSKLMLFKHSILKNLIYNHELFKQLQKARGQELGAIGFLWLRIFERCLSPKNSVASTSKVIILISGGILNNILVSVARVCLFVC